MIPKRIVILGSGHSIRQNLWSFPVSSLSLWEAIKDEFVISLNWSYKFCNPDIAMFCDYAFYEVERENLKKLSIVVGPDDSYFYRKGIKTAEKNTYLYKANTKYSKGQWDKIYVPQLVGIPAITLSALLECNEIYLLGYDANCDEQERTHFYQDDNITGIYKWANQTQNGMGKDNRGNYRTDNYNKIKELNDFWFKPFEQLKNDNINVYNVSINSEINTFPKITYQEFYQRIKHNKPNKENLNKELHKLFKEKLS